MSFCCNGAIQTKQVRLHPNNNHRELKNTEIWEKTHGKKTCQYTDKHKSKPGSDTSSTWSLTGSPGTTLRRAGLINTTYFVSFWEPGCLNPAPQNPNFRLVSPQSHDCKKTVEFATVCENLDPSHVAYNLKGSLSNSSRDTDYGL